MRRYAGPNRPLTAWFKHLYSVHVDVYAEGENKSGFCAAITGGA